MARTVAGAGWVVGWRMATRVLGLLSTLVLVRLLAPADFGLVALATTFVVAVDTLSALGVEDSLVRERAPTRAMYDTAFTMNAARGALTALILAVAAVPVARFFDDPRLADVVWALAAGSVLGGVGNIGMVEYRRAMRFGMEFVVQILPRVVSILVTIGAAVVLRSYWALIVGLLTSRVLGLVLGYRLHPFRPRLGLSAWRPLLGFSAWSWAISMACLVRDRLDAFALGRLIDTTAVGVYNIGEEVAGLPTTELVAPLGRSAFSGFAVARAENAGAAEVFTRITAGGFLLTFPAGLGLSAVADPLVRLAVGENWLAAIPVIAVLGVGGAVSVFGIVGGTFLSAHALLGRQFAVVVACLCLRLLFILPLIGRYGVLGAALGTLASTLAEHALIVGFVMRATGLRVADLLRQNWRTAAAGAGMAALLAWTGLGWAAGGGGAPAGHLAAGVAAGAGTYGALLGGLWLLSGRPPGTEATLVAAGRRAWRGLGGRVRPVLRAR